MPGAVGLGCSGHNELDVVTKGPALVQLLGSDLCDLLETVSMGWVGKGGFESPALVQLLGSDLGDLLETVSMGWVVVSRLVVVTEGRVSPQSTHLGVVIKSPVLVQLLGSDLCDLLDTVSKGWVGRFLAPGQWLRPAGSWTCLSRW